MGDKKKIYNLPNEMIIEIFKHLGIEDKIRLGETCKWMHDNCIESIREEGIKVYFSIKKGWLGGSRDTFGHETTRIWISTKEGKTEKTYLNEKIEEGFNQVWKSELIYDKEIKAHYFKDDYTEFEKIYKCEVVYYRHKGNLYVRVEKYFEKRKWN
jgi:hypothetical protein